MKRTSVSVLVIFLLFLWCTVAHADLEVHFLDVGQGDAAIVLCDGDAMIIDGGPGSASSFMYSYIQNTLQLEYVNYVVATHPHEDHIGGLSAVMNAVPVDLVLSPVLEWDTQAWASFARYTDLQGTPMLVPFDGDTLSLGGAIVTIVYCWPEAWTTNDMSICLRVDYGDTSFLFTGDAEYMAEYTMIDGEILLSADVLKIAHHGSRSSSTLEFLENVQPTYAVISCGRENSYGHPHEETLNSLYALNVDLFRTDLQGTIIARSDGNEIEFSTEYQASEEELFTSPSAMHYEWDLEEAIIDDGT